MNRDLKRVQAIEKARDRRASSAAARNVEIQWFIDQVSNKVRKSLSSRLNLAVQLLRNRVVINISDPVIKIVSSKVVTGKRSKKPKTVSHTIVRGRSKPGEFPKADTTLLMKTIFSEIVDDGNGTISGYVGTPLMYGVILELFMSRSFLVRTLNDSRQDINGILLGPIKK